MSINLLSSKVAVVEEAPKVRGIPAAPTSVAGAIGSTEKGPFGKAVLCTSFDEYQSTFGGFTPSGALALAAMGFFENGGSRLWVSRVTSATTAVARVELSKTVTIPDGPAVVIGTKNPPFSFDDPNLNILDAETLVDGTYTDQHIEYDAHPAIAVSVGEPYALVDGQTLIVSVDYGPPQTVIFHTNQFEHIGSATAYEVQLAIGTQIDGVGINWGNIGNGLDTGISIFTSSNGTASHLEISGTAAPALGFAGVNVDGTGEVQNAASVSLAEILAGQAQLVPPLAFELFDAGNVVGVRSTALGSQVRLVVETYGGVYEWLGLDRDYHYGTDVTSTPSILTIEAVNMGFEGNHFAVRIDPPTSGTDGEFNFLVYVDDVLTETFINVSRDVLHPRFVETVVNAPDNGSTLVRVKNLPGAPGVVPDMDLYPLVGGDDGTAALTDTDFVGDEASKTGLHAFDAVQDLTLILAPGRVSPAVHGGMLAYCEEYRDGSVFAILDPPVRAGAEDIVTYVTTTASLESSSEYGAIYWPRVQILNPDPSVFGTVKTIMAPPSGIIAGVFSRTDGETPGGVYTAPAGIEAGKLFGVLGFESDETFIEKKRDLVYPHRINPLTTGPGLPKFIDGSRTLKGDGNFPAVAARRGVTFIEQSLKQGLSFGRHQANTPELRAQVRRTITAFLLAQMNNGAFQSRDPSKAFFVDVSDLLNSPSVVAAGKLIARVGVAMNRPTEFIILEISQDTRALDEELATAG